MTHCSCYSLLSNLYCPLFYGPSNKMSSRKSKLNKDKCNEQMGFKRRASLQGNPYHDYKEKNDSKQRNLDPNWNTYEQINYTYAAFKQCQVENYLDPYEDSKRSAHTSSLSPRWLLPKNAD